MTRKKSDERAKQRSRRGKKFTPRYPGRRSPLRIDVRKSVEGPEGPHLFRHSSAYSSEFSLAFDHALQLSPSTAPLRASIPSTANRIDETLHSPAPSTTITETAYIVPSLGQSWQSEDPKLWSAQQVAVWMKDSRACRARHHRLFHRQ